MPDYQKLEELLYRGFLTLKGEIGDVPVVLKTLNNKERNLVALRSSSHPTSRYSYHIAYSILFFDGINILKNREEYLPLMVDYIQEIPEKVANHLLTSIQYLNSQAVEEVEHVEPYSFGDPSRSQWLSRKESEINSPRYTGIEGTEKLGLNMHQETWVAINRSEDRRDKFNDEWELAAFQASAWNSEGVEKVRNKKKREEKKKRKRREALYKTKGASDIQEGKREIHIQRESPEELLEQMERDNEGIKDFHDKVVEQHEEEIRQKAIEEEKKWQERKLKAREKQKEDLSQVNTDEDFVVLDEEEVEEHKRKQEKQRREKMEKGAYKTRAEFDQATERLQKWDIIEGKDKLKETGRQRVERLQENDEEEEDSGSKGVPESMEGTLLEDYYKEVSGDLKETKNMDLPDIIDDSGD